MSKSLLHELEQFRPHRAKHAGGVGRQHCLPVIIGGQMDGMGQEVVLTVKIQRLG